MITRLEEIPVTKESYPFASADRYLKLSERGYGENTRTKKRAQFHTCGIKCSGITERNQAQNIGAGDIPAKGRHITSATRRNASVSSG